MSGDAIAQSIRNARIATARRKRRADLEKVGKHQEVRKLTGPGPKGRLRCLKCKTEVVEDHHGRDILKDTECYY